jgi:hypothetical protein
MRSASIPHICAESYKPTRTAREKASRQATPATVEAGTIATSRGARDVRWTGFGVRYDCSPWPESPRPNSEAQGAFAPGEWWQGHDQGGGCDPARLRLGARAATPAPGQTTATAASGVKAPVQPMPRSSAAVPAPAGYPASGFASCAVLTSAAACHSTSGAGNDASAGRYRDGHARLGRRGSESAIARELELVAGGRGGGAPGSGRRCACRGAG